MISMLFVFAFFCVSFATCSLLPHLDPTLRLAKRLDTHLNTYKNDNQNIQQQTQQTQQAQQQHILQKKTIEDSLIINTNYGPIQGYNNGNAHVWSSIPYAKPPIGDLRWSLPENPDSWTETLDTTKDPNGCLQNCSLGWYACPTVVSEDCLYLNVFRPPHVTSDDSTPVMIFIHGGDYYEGYGGGLLYNGTDLVNLTDIILVTINYRLGAQGFLYDKDANFLGNFGYWDQVFAIEWVYQNIQHFGGNPEHITLFGESAGGVSVGTHLMNTSNTIIKAAIQESNPFGIPLRTPDTWGELGTYFKDEAGCSLFETNEELISCLRGLSASQILSAQAKAETSLIVETGHFMNLFMPWCPTVGTNYSRDKNDEILLPEQPFHAFQKGKILNIPFITGINKNEGTIFTYEAFTTPVSFTEYLGILTVLMGGIEDAKQISEHYMVNNTNSSDYRPVLADIATDGLFICPNRNISSILSNNNLTPNYPSNSNYMYHFNHLSSFVKIAFPNDPACWDKVCHGAELPYVFRPNISPANGSFTIDEYNLAENIQWYWATFASKFTPMNGNPNNPMTWNSFGNNENVIIFDVPSNDGGDGMMMQSFYDKEKCDFWDSLSYNWLPNP